MDEILIFNLTIPSNEYFGFSASPILLSIGSYQSGKLISYYSGSTLSDLYLLTIEQTIVEKKDNLL